MITSELLCRKGWWDDLKQETRLGTEVTSRQAWMRLIWGNGFGRTREGIDFGVIEDVSSQDSIISYNCPNLIMLLLSRFSRVRLCATPWTAAYQASPSMGFSRQEHWSGLPFPSPVSCSRNLKYLCMHAKSLQSCLTLRSSQPSGL